MQISGEGNHLHTGRNHDGRMPDLRMESGGRGEEARKASGEIRRLEETGKEMNPIVFLLAVVFVCATAVAGLIIAELYIHREYYDLDDWPDWSIGGDEDEH